MPPQHDDPRSDDRRRAHDEGARPVVALSQPLPPAALGPLAELADIRMPSGPGPTDLIELMAPAEFALVTPFERVDERLLEAAPRLRQLITVSAGFDHIDVAACTRRGIRVANTPGAVASATADHAFALLLAAARRIVEADAFARAGRWQGGIAPILGHDVSRITLGIVGMGRIGKLLVRRAHGFDMDVAYYTRTRRAEAEENALGIRYLPLDDLLATSDAVILQVAHSPETQHLVDERRLGLMKPTAVLVNTARGGVVDDEALAAALAAGRLAAAGLDVFEGEPQINPRLRALPNVVLTPHLGANTVATHQRMAQEALANLIGTLHGAPLADQLNAPTA